LTDPGFALVVYQLYINRDSWGIVNVEVIFFKRAISFDPNGVIEKIMGLIGMKKDFFEGVRNLVLFGSGNKGFQILRLGETANNKEEERCIGKIIEGFFHKGRVEGKVN
jgi:hypothetical protein